MPFLGDVPVRDQVRIPGVSDDRGHVAAFRGHIINAGDEPLESPLLALGDLGGRRTGRSLVVIEPLQDILRRPADGLRTECELGPGREAGLEGEVNLRLVPPVIGSNPASLRCDGDDLEIPRVQGKGLEGGIERLCREERRDPGMIVVDIKGQIHVDDLHRDLAEICRVIPEDPICSPVPLRIPGRFLHHVSTSIRCVP